MTDRLHRDRAPTIMELLIDFVKTRLLSIIGVFGLGAILWMLVGADLSIPRGVQIFALAFLFVLPYGYIFGNYLTSLLWSPNFIYVVDLDARYTDGALYQFPYENFRDLDVRGGDLDQLSPNLYTARDVDLDELQATGVWRGTLSDRELMLALSKIDECRNQLEEDAKKGFALQAQAWTIIRNCVRSGVLHVVETFERETLPDDGEGINDEIESALSRFDLDERISEELDDLDDLDEEQIDDLERTPDDDHAGTRVDQADDPTPEVPADDD